MIDYKLHIPGPVDVSQGAFKALTTPVMGHRSLILLIFIKSANPSFRLFMTQDPVFLSTSSAWGVMEGQFVT